MRSFLSAPAPNTLPVYAGLLAVLGGPIAAAETLLLKPIAPVIGEWTLDQEEGEVAQMEVGENLDGLGMIARDGRMVTGLLS